MFSIHLVRTNVGALFSGPTFKCFFCVCVWEGGENTQCVCSLFIFIVAPAAAHRLVVAAEVW